jgi:ATP-dependent Clp protease ATP-binding subunit ClpC
MHSPFTQSLASALADADAEARKFGQEFVGTEHLLLGILSCEHSQATRALKARINVTELRGKVVQSLPNSRKPTGVTGRLSLSPKAQGFLNTAMSLSQAEGHENISTRLVLRAMLSDTESAAITAISDSGADLDDLRRALRESADQPEP